MDMPDYVAVWRTDKSSEPVVFRSATGRAGGRLHARDPQAGNGWYLWGLPWDLDKLSWPKEEKQEGTKKK